jgi:hypothetical protein
MAYCTKCGNQLSDLAVACPKCGTQTELGSRSAFLPLEGDYANAPELRALGVGEVIDVSIKLFRKHAATLLKTVAVVVAPVQILGALILVSVTPGDAAFTFPSTTPGFDEPAAVDPGAIWPTIVATLITTVLGFVSGQLATAASMKAITEGYLGEEPDWKDSLRFAFQRIRSLIWLAIMSGFLIVVGLVLCVVPGIWLAVSWFVAVPVLLVEGERGWSALKRSFDLVKSRFWPVLGVAALGQIISSVISAILGAGFILLTAFVIHGELASFLGSAIASSLASILITPFIAATTAIVYLDLRVRKEGLDLELLARRIGDGPAAEPGLA